MRTTYQVTGMTCDHCVQAVSSEIEEIAGVSGASTSTSRPDGSR